MQGRLLLNFKKQTRIPLPDGRRKTKEHERLNPYRNSTDNCLNSGVPARSSHSKNTISAETIVTPKTAIR
jgi:hypothetical protein